MASLDDVFDLKDRLDEEGLDYLIVTSKYSEKSDNRRSDVFYRLRTEDSAESLHGIINDLCENFHILDIGPPPRKNKND